ncbi:MAG: trypsin-like peptidase domain-containing protein [Planctomycetes bacterium]|nr:trypsin-like peptidase domain-containing protein [Planctomycetota bacterium]
MPIRLVLRAAESAPQRFDFGDEVVELRIGRDPMRCQVVLPPEARMVSREHCALQRVLGRYRLILNGENPVRVDGRTANEGEVLPARCSLEIGVDGPVLRVEVTQAAELDPTALAEQHRLEHVGAKVERISRRGRWNAAAIGATAVALLCAAYAGWSLLRTAEEALEFDLTSAREFLRAEIAAVDQRAAERAQALERAVRRASAAVFLVLVENDAGVQSAAGTAWVCGVGMLATNAHVAEIGKGLPEGWRLLVRSRWPEPRTLRVEKLEVHPGYALFEELNASFRPQVSAAMGWDQDVRLLTACDVALLLVDASQPLPAALPLAEPEVLESLAAGQEIGFVGYPTEGMLNVNLDRPEPVVQLGRVTSTSDFFFGAAAAPECQLVHFSMPATGGASGSPILDAEGRVVAILCAGNVQRVITGFSLQRDAAGQLVGVEPTVERSPLAVGVNFSQRADLVRELVNGTAPQLQEPRRTTWKEAFSRYLSATSGPEEIAAHAWRIRFGAAARLPEPVLQLKAQIGTQGPMGATILGLESLTPGRYFAVAISAPRLDIDMHVLKGRGRAWRERELADERPNHWPQAVIEVQADHRYAVAVFSGLEEAAGSEFELRVYRVPQGS